MSRTSAGKLVLEAKNVGSAVGAFNVILLEHAEALVEGAETSKLPVILQISENCVNYHGALKPISVATIAIAEAANVPVSVHLDHAESEDLVREALDLDTTQSCLTVQNFHILKTLQRVHEWPITDIDVLITDDGVDPKFVRDFRALGVEIVIV